MLCYRCGSHVPDGSPTCGTCGQALSSGGIRHATGTFSRKKLKGLKVEGAPYSQGSLIASRYLVKDTVGAGPHGFVFRALDKEIDVEVAVKVVNPRLVQTPEERKVFSREIRLGRKLSHGNLVRIYEDGEDGDRPYFTMQYLDGLPLRRVVDLRKEKGQFFTVREVEPIVLQVAQALEGAHKVGPHSDVRPENMIILPDVLKLTDFGLGMAIPRVPFANAMKAQHADAYLAPEYTSAAEVDGRADVYSLGVLMGEMLAGVMPDGSVPSLRAINRDVPERVEAIYQRAVNANPLARFARAADLAAELAEVARTLPPSRSALAKRPAASPPSPPKEEPKPKPLPPPPPVGELRSEPIAAKPRKPPPPPPEAFVVPSNGASGHTEPAPIPVSAKSPPPVPIEAIAKPREKPTSKVDGPRPDGAVRRSAVAIPRPLPKKRRTSRSAIWFIALVVVGVGTGAGAGVLILDVMNRPTRANRAPTALEKPPEPAQEPTPSPVAPMAVATPSPSPTPAPAPALAVPQPAPAETPAPAPAPPDVKKAEAAKAAADIMREAKEAKREERQHPAEESKPKEEARPKKAESKRVEAEKHAAASEPAEVETSPPPERKPISPGKKVAMAAPPPEKGDTEDVAAASHKGSCPNGMKYIGAGSFRMGSSKDDPMMGFDEKPLAPTDTDGYCIDVYEYPGQRGAMPKVNVSFSGAEAACKGKGKRLCTEEEWERACKGPGGNARYPYGPTFDADACNTRDADDADRTVAETGRFSRCRSGYGIADMSGNVAEWTGTRFGAGVSERAVKGGSYQRPDYDTRCAARKPTAPDTREPTLGFRCCTDPR